MASRPKLLILDDEQDFLEVCKELLSGLSSHPEILTATSGSRALALLESEPFSLLLTDLRMPNMDGFQVLAIVRRRLPSLRIVVMTGAVEEQFRARAYAMGIDLFVEKPKSQKETELFFDCIESMLGPTTQQVGFRGVQQKSLVDIIQLECLTQSSAVMKVISGPSTGTIWLQSGNIIDAVTADRTAEDAFREILSWKVGNFEILPGDPKHTRRIMASSQGLLLDTAQALDEAATLTAQEPEEQSLPKLARIGRTKGVEFLLTVSPDGGTDQWSCENSEAIALFAQRVIQEFRAVGTSLKAGAPSQIEGYGPQRHIAIAPIPGRDTIVAGFDRTMPPAQVSTTFKQVLSKWES